jgi:hypothetical protein
MKRKITILFLVLVICVSSLALFGCAEDGGSTAHGSVAVLAEVEKISGGKIYIRGLTEGFTSRYVFSEAGVMFCREGEEDIAAEIEVGDKITVTFTGIATKDDPGTMYGVTKVVQMNK